MWMKTFESDKATRGLVTSLLYPKFLPRLSLIWINNPKNESNKSLKFIIFSNPIMFERKDGSSGVKIFTKLADLQILQRILFLDY